MVASKEVVCTGKEQPVHSQLTAGSVASFQSHTSQASSKHAISTEKKQLVHSQPAADPAGSWDERGSAYHKALRKHIAYFKSCDRIDVVDCLETLRAEDYASDADVNQAEEILANQGTKAAVKFLFSKLINLSEKAMCFFVEDVLSSQDDDHPLMATLQLCHGPGKCSLRSGQAHESDSGSSSSSIRREQQTSERATVMSEFHTGILRECHVDLHERLEMDDHLLGRLYDNFIVSRPLRDRVCREVSHEARASLLLDELPRCGGSAFREFVDALEASDKRANNTLANTLKAKALR